MEKIDSTISEIKGAEGIVIHNENIVLGMQQPKRWYRLENGKIAAIIKTLGGKIEEEDEKNSKKALLREVIEEVKNIGIKDININNTPIFAKSIDVKELNPYEINLDLKMTADFYFVEILNNKNIIPNDLPALVEIPIEEFMNLNLAEDTKIEKIEKYIIKNNKYRLELPEHYALMIPEEVKEFLKTLKGRW